jgi:hypothetical protein
MRFSLRLASPLRYGRRRTTGEEMRPTRLLLAAGRPATGRDPCIVVRFPPVLTEAVDAWANRAGDAVTRSEAIRRLVERGLAIPAIFRSDILEIANGSGSARDRMAEAKKRTEFYKRMSIEFHREDFERVESDLQSLDDSLKVTGAPARVLQVIEHARGYLKDSVEEMRLKAKGGKR